MNEEKKKILKRVGFAGFILVMIIISIFLMIKYEAEGEKNMPFELSKIIIQSSVDAENRKSEYRWDVNLEQNNDIYIYIEENENYKKDEEIKSVKLDNIKILDENKVGELKILIPTSNDIKTAYANSKEDYKEKEIEYTGNSIDNMQKQEICKKGGLVAFRNSNSNIGEFVSNEGNELSYDGTLLEKANINEEDLKIKLEMDLCIETISSKKYNTTIELEVPVEKFGESGIVSKTITDFSDLVFKRE